jgi:hypothetical protein
MKNLLYSIYDKPWLSAYSHTYDSVNYYASAQIRTQPLLQRFVQIREDLKKEIEKWKT